MNKRLNSAIITAAACVLITACGSGGGGSTQTEQTNTNANPTTITSSTTVAASSAANTSTSSTVSASSSSTAIISSNIKTGDLIAEEDFNFATQKDITINVAIENSETHNIRYQLNFYTDYQNQQNTYLPHFKTHFASGTVVNGQFNQTVQLPTTTKSVLAELWTYDGAAPTQAIINIENNSITWKL